MDSIVSVPFNAEHVNETSLLVNGVFFRNDEKIYDRPGYSQKVFKVLSTNDKIEV